HPDDLEGAVERWNRSVATGTEYYTEFRIRGKNGLYRWVAARAVPLKDKNNRVQKWYGTNADIHDVKALSHELESAHLQLESEKEKFETIFADSSTSMAVLQGPLFVYENANPSYLRLFNNRDLLGRPFLQALPELEGQQFPMQAKKVFETGEPYIEVEAKAYLMRTDQGPLEERYFDQSYTRMLDGTGQPYGVFIHATEVTDRVMARRKYEETAERFRIAVESANMGTWEVIPQTGVVDWSPRTSELFGVPKEKQLHLSEAVVNIHPDDIDRVNKAIAAATDPNGDGAYEIEYRVVKPDGQSRWLSLLGKSFFADTPEGRQVTRFSGTVLDVTDRMTAEVELRDAKERAELASAAKSSFLANMSHEIRTPLGAIMGFVSLIKDETLNPQTLLQYVNVIERNSAQLMRIIDDILDLSKVEAGMMLIEHINFSLVELLSDFSSLMGFRAREKGIIFELRAKTELPSIISSDPTRIRQILTNIVGNAIKFTERGSVVLNVCFADGKLEFEVIDTGRGISADQSERLFQPFTQADPSTTRKYGGTGLGLVLTRRLSEAMGGTFELVTSELERGSTFRSVIEVQLTEATQFVRALGFASEVIRNAGIRGELGGLKVLLVEDSPDNQALFSIYLSRAGASIDIAPDGLVGVEMATKGTYDVILMDVQMPVMDGITAVRTLRSKGFAKPVMALTAHAMKEEKIRCLEAGYTGFLSKPIQRGELIDALKPFMKSNP
ncbi:MAG: response regulator, partial [Proteobacteria bacterium]